MAPTITEVPDDVVDAAKACFATFRSGAVQAKVVVDDDVVDVGAAGRERLVVAEADGFVLTMHVRLDEASASIRGMCVGCLTGDVVLESATGVIHVESVGAEFIVEDVPKGPVRIVLSSTVGGADVVTDWVVL